MLGSRGYRGGVCLCLVDYRLTDRVQEGSWCWLGRFRGMQSGWRGQHGRSLRERQCCGLCAIMKDKSQKS